MVNHSGRLDATFGALADPTRRAILGQLALSPEASVSELAHPFAISLPAISKHLQVLENAGLLARRRDGRVHHCRLVAEPMKSASAWIARYQECWERRLDALQRYLDETVEEIDEEDTPWSRRKRPRRRKAASGSPARSKPRSRGSTGPGRTRSS